MAAGLGFKTFNTGEVLTSADVNGYLMQGVLVFASEAARDAAITSPQEGQFAYTKDNNSLWYYDSAAWVASGATGDIEGVTAGTGISGGGTSGTVTITNSMATEIDAKGDLVVGTGADTFARLAVGTDGHTLVADSVETTGLKWAAPSAGASFAGAEITHTANTQTIANNTWTKVVFNSETYDVGGYAASGSTITIPSGKGGYYLVIGWAYFDSNATGVRNCRIYENGSPTYLSRGWASNATVYPQVGIQNVVAAAATDTIEFYVYQSSGGNLTLYVDPDDAGLSVAYLGA
jgi:hypothetical protein